MVLKQKVKNSLFIQKVLFIFYSSLYIHFANHLHEEIKYRQSDIVILALKSRNTIIVIESAVNSKTIFCC